MIHLTDNQIYNLADSTLRGLPYDDEQLLCLEHLRECEGCFRIFCATLAVRKSVAQGLKAYSANSKLHKSEREKLIACIRILKSRVNSKPVYELIQFDNPYQKLMFTSQKGSSLTPDSSDCGIQRYEDKSNKSSYVTIDNKSKRLNIQIDTSQFDCKDIDVYVCEGNNWTILPSSKINNILVTDSYTLSKDTEIQIEMR